MTKARDLADLLDGSGNLKQKDGRTLSGRHVKTDGEKLDGIEANATADQDHSEIRALISIGVDTNVFTDADHSKLNAIEASATADQTDAEIRAAVESAADSNVFTDADHTKLNAIEAGATADQTKSDIDALNIDADTLDGQHGSYYTGYTDTAVANIVDSSPAALDTLNELAAALGDDPNFATTVSTNIGGKVSKSGDTMTGNLVLTNTGKIYDDDNFPLVQVNSSKAYFGSTSRATTTLASSSTITHTTNGGTYRIFTEDYHPNADKWTTARTLSLSGDASGSVSWDGSANATLSVAVANDSHTHDGRYYTETEADSRFVNVTGDTMTSDLIINSIGANNIAASANNIKVSGYGIVGNRSTFYVTNSGSVQIGVGGHHNGDSAMTFGTSSNVSHKTLFENSNRVFNDGYHPNADKWTTARTLSLSGDASGSVSWDGSANATLSVTVANDSHNHTNFTVNGVTDLNSVSGSGVTKFRPFVTEFQASNSAGSNYNGGFAVGTRATGYESQFAFLASGAATAPRYRNKTNDTWNSWYTLWSSGNDGAGSGLDADLLDGVQGSSYLRSDTADTATGDLTLGVVNITNEVRFPNNTSLTDVSLTGTSDQDTGFNWSGSNAVNYVSGGVLKYNLNNVWHSGNDGSGSGLDADLLDGRDSLTFGNTLATYGTAGSASGRIRCTAPFNTNSAHMFQITVSVYSSYDQHTYVVGGYMYPTTNQWHSPTVVYSGTGSPDIKVGRDNNGKAYISIANGNYTGVRVHNMTLGYQTSVADISDPWTITINGGTENSVTPTVSKVWNSTNGGSGSGLDADLLDGVQGSSFLRSDASDTFTTLSGTTLTTGSLTIGSSAKINFQNNDSISYNDADGVGAFSFNADAGTANALVKAGAATFSSVNINGNLNAVDHVYLAGNVYHEGDTNTYMGFHASDQWRVVTGGSERLEVNNTHVYASRQFRSNSNITAYYSDMRLKTKTSTIDDALGKVGSLEGFYYVENEVARENGYNNDKQQVALSAQAVQAVMPEAIHPAPFDVGIDENDQEYSKSGENYLTVDYARLVPLLVEAIKELKSEVEELKSKIEG